jgi:hypothetical protein
LNRNLKKKGEERKKIWENTLNLPLLPLTQIPNEDYAEKTLVINFNEFCIPHYSIITVIYNKDEGRRRTARSEALPDRTAHLTRVNLV